jgi:hypothetical protein
MPPKEKSVPFLSNCEFIKRSPNCFMIWSSYKRTQILKSKSIEKNSNISIMLGQMWNKMPYEDKLPYVNEANKKKLEHKIKYPNYIYRPKKKEKGIMKIKKNSNNYEKENNKDKQNSKDKEHIIKEITIDIEEPDYYNELQLFYENNIDIKFCDVLYEVEVIYDTVIYDL